MGGVSLKGLKIQNNKHGEKYLNIILKNASDRRVRIFEQIDKIKPSEYAGKKEFEIPFCVKDPYNGPKECAALFSNELNDYALELDNYIITDEGDNCRSLIFRPGSIIEGWDGWLDKFYFNGRKCKIIYRGPPITEKLLFNCCTNNTKDKCHETISNGYTTSHCDFTMYNYCLDNPEKDECMIWLEKTVERDEEIGLSLYSDLCSKDHEKQYCSYMCMLSRKDGDGRSKYCDIALKNWCKKNSDNKNCFCTNTPDNLIPEYEELLGPKECWLSECTAKNKDQKWLTTEQLQTRKGCKILSCIIDIDKLTLEEGTKIELTNNCLVGGKSSRDVFSEFINLKDITKIQTWGSLLSIPFLLILFSFLILYLFKSNN